MSIFHLSLPWVNPLAKRTILTPTQVKQINSSELSLLWSDGHKGVTSLGNIRDACPCAGCNGETVLLRSYIPPSVDRNTPGRYDLKGIETVGCYALKFVWGDGHDMELYTWEHLRDLCECPECSLKRRKLESA